MTILVRNLSREVTREELWEMFVPFGRIKSLSLVMDPATGKSKGFGFVDMPKDIEGAAAIKALNGAVVKGEKIRVKVSNQKSRPSLKRLDRSAPPRRPYMGKKNFGRKADPVWHGANRRNPPARRGK
jgi:RNA recognition motif-containing protein